jgi:predicted transcriptional regulator
MLSNAQALVVTRPQEACLSALRQGTTTLGQIAITARLSIKRTKRALSDLESFGLAERSPDAGSEWRVTPLGGSCGLILADPEESRKESPEPSPSGRRLLGMLERPIEGRRVAKTLGLSRQGAMLVLRRLHRQGHVRLADPQDLSWWVLRADDDTPVLTREQERVISALPGAYATDAVQIKRQTGLSKDTIEAALKYLIGVGLAEAAGEFNRAALFRATPEGDNHWQKRPEINVAEPPHMPVYSDRVQGMLSAISNAGALRVRDVKTALGWNFQATNALIQYLKRKNLIEKAGDAFEAPYVLTAMGALTLIEMVSPGRMAHGYEPGSNQAVRLAKVQLPQQAHPKRIQRVKRSAKVKDPRPPVTSDRVRAVLTMIADAGSLRIKDISDSLRVPHQTINALIQYLKRKGFLQKTAEGLAFPYMLTASGRVVLAQLEQRMAA